MLNKKTPYDTCTAYLEAFDYNDDLINAFQFDTKSFEFAYSEVLEFLHDSQRFYSKFKFLKFRIDGYGVFPSSSGVISIAHSFRQELANDLQGDDYNTSHL